MVSDLSAGSQEVATSCASAHVRGVIFDGDDTLWLTEALYDDARKLARSVVEQAGLDGAEWDRIERVRDLENVAVLGHSANRFPTSCLEALSSVGGDALADGDNVRARVLDAARSVFVASAPPRAGANDVLDRLALRGIRLALLTKGDRVVQEGRVAHSGLAHHFDVVSVVDVKSAEAFVSVAKQLGLEPNEIISVGNSVESDIMPSLAAGIAAIWIPAYVWDHERRHDASIEPSLHQIRELGELVALLGA